MTRHLEVRRRREIGQFQRVGLNQPLPRSSSTPSSSRCISCSVILLEPACKKEHKDSSLGGRDCVCPSTGYTARSLSLFHPLPTPGPLSSPRSGSDDRLQKRPSCLPDAYAASYVQYVHAHARLPFLRLRSCVCVCVRGVYARVCEFGTFTWSASARSERVGWIPSLSSSQLFVNKLCKSVSPLVLVFFFFFFLLLLLLLLFSSLGFLLRFRAQGWEWRKMIFMGIFQL